MDTVAANVNQLIGFNRSMAVALEKAENGSSVEDGYFFEKLDKTANCLGYELKRIKMPDSEIYPRRQPDDEQAPECDRDDCKFWDNMSHSFFTPVNVEKCTECIAEDYTHFEPE